MINNYFCYYACIIKLANYIHASSVVMQAVW